MTTDPRDAELRDALAVVCDTDRGENPFAWTDPPAAPPADEEPVR